MLQFNIISLFPEMFSALNYGVIGRALEKQRLELQHFNPRNYSKENYRRVDDRPYGGGPGMVMLAQPLQDAITAAKTACPQTKAIYLTPQGEPLTQNIIKSLSGEPSLTLIAGRYEGIDERVITNNVDMELSIGDYVLSGGELAAMVVIDAVARLLPKVLGHADSAAQDSFMDGFLDCPHYTRPESFNGQLVPNVLLNGNHKAIARWRLKQALGRTYLRRPELLKKRRLSSTEQELLTEFINKNERDKL